MSRHGDSLASLQLTRSCVYVQLTGDMNVDRSSIEYRLLIGLLGLHDSYRICNPEDDFSVTDYFDKKTLDYILYRGALHDNQRAPILNYDATHTTTTEHTALTHSLGCIAADAAPTRCDWSVKHSLICMTHETFDEEKEAHAAWMSYCRSLTDVEADRQAAKASVLDARVSDNVLIFSDHKGVSATLVRNDTSHNIDASSNQLVSDALREAFAVATADAAHSMWRKKWHIARAIIFVGAALVLSITLIGVLTLWIVPLLLLLAALLEVVYVFAWKSFEVREITRTIQLLQNQIAVYDSQHQAHYNHRDSADDGTIGADDVVAV
jgi:hypothetical protein